jgi:hypothetical protein
MLKTDTHIHVQYLEPSLLENKSLELSKALFTASSTNHQTKTHTKQDRYT